MKKILDFILVFLLIFFIFNLFNSEKNKDVQKTENVIFKTIKPDYAVPAWVQLLIENNTQKELSLNTCENIALRDSWWNIVEFPKDFCKNTIIQPWKSETIDYSTYFEKFQNEWIYTFNLDVEERKLTSQFEIEHRWTIWKLFVGLIYAPIYNLMVSFLNLFSYSLWWSIISITILVRLFLLWPQHKMLLSQKRLQAIQPKIKKIQKEHKWDQQKMWIKLMELYKEEKVNPMWSCGFMLIQMPILLVMYRIILNIKDPSNTFYLYNVFSDFNTNMISYDFFWIDLTSKWWIVWLALAIFIGIIQFIQVKLSLSLKEKDKQKEIVVLEKKKWENDYSSMMPDPNSMNKFMMYWMPVMVWFFTYSLFAWVGLYWWMSTLFAIAQQIIVNKVFKKSR